ncbi:MAG: hypothetical protein C5B52_13290 [Bacteroidetes bacterium]|nr:MAG: hypothetical protein C5B52_13290 [Bacteroidota bacterium]
MKRNTLNYAAIYLVFFIFFLFHLTSNFSASHDSIDYLYEFESGINLIQPHHLFYHFTTFGLFRFLQWIFPHIKSYYLIETVTAAWASGVLLVVYQILKNRFQISSLNSLLTCCMICFSFGFWYYSTNIEVYMPPLFFTLLTLNEVAKKNFNLKKAILFHAMAILFHQVNVLMAPIILWRIWKERNNSSAIKSLLAYAIIGGGSVLIIYIILGSISIGQFNIPEWIKWAEGYTRSSKYWFPAKLSTLFNAFVGFSHALIGGQFVFQVPFIRDFLENKFFYHNLTDETYLVRNLSEKYALALLLLTMVLLVVIVVITILILKKSKTIWRSEKITLAPFLLFLVIYSIFFFFWMPENLEFWIPQSVVIWILIGGLSKYWSKSPRSKYVLSFIALSLFVINYWGSVKWLLNIENDIFYAKTKTVCNQADPADILLLEDNWITDGYLKRCTHAKLYIEPTSNDSLERKTLDDAIQNCLSTNHKIYIFQEKTFMHGVKDATYVDSLINSFPSRTKDLGEPLTPIKVIQ